MQTKQMTKPQQREGNHARKQGSNLNIEEHVLGKKEEASICKQTNVNKQNKQTIIISATSHIKIQKYRGNQWGVTNV